MEDSSPKEDEYELNHSTHTIHKRHVAFVLCMITGYLQIKINVSKWRVYRPRKH